MGPRLVLVVMLASATAACLRPPSFQCTTDENCGPGGACEPVGFCSYADPDCGRRFNDLAGKYADQCVEEAPLADGTIRYVPLAEETVGAADLTIGDCTFNSDTLALSCALTGFTAVTIAQEDPTHEIAIIRAKALVISGTLTLIGPRPVAFLADTVSIDGELTLGANGSTPGAGGAGKDLGPGAGGFGPGGSKGTWGGGGGGFALVGGAGGRNDDMTLSGAAGGAAYAELLDSALVGGSGGGSVPTGCTAVAGGGGGGAVLVYAATMLSVTGRITAGGGAGRGGPRGCGSTQGGGGGGSGGAIVLQSPMVTIGAGAGVFAKGGGGGGGGSSSNGAPGEGNGGEDGDDAAIGAASGGSAASGSGRGGNGGAEEPPTDGTTVTGASVQSGGGGGGSVGVVWIYSQQPPSVLGSVVPVATETTY